MLDSQKIRSLVPNADMQLYEKLILMSVGLSGLEKRYNISAQENDSLQNIVLELQLRDDELKEKTERILDYLYSIISNQGEDAKFYLQIQKMDLRNAAVSKVDDHTYALIPQVTGDAKKIVEKNSCSKFVQNRNEFKQLIDTCCNKMHDGRFSLLECFDVITRVQLLIENMEAPGLLQNFLVMIIAYALTKDEITTEQRSKLCGIWLKGIDGIFNNGSFAFEIGLVSILYKQIEYELEEDIKIQMKKQMFNCLLYRGQQGIITKVSSYLKKYLQQNEKIAQLFFYTIIAIAEDQMACYKYNVNKLCGIGRLRKHLFEKYYCEMDEHCTENVVNMMTNEFPTSAAKKTYAQCVFLKKEQDDYGISDSYEKMLQNPEFCAILEELVDFGISRYKVNYSYHYQDTNLVLYQKYTYEDACRLLNWERNEVPLNIGGYKYDKKTKTFPIFINYDKQDNISDTTKYEDHL